MGTCISRCDCSCTRSSSPVLPQLQQQQELTQPTIHDKLVILSSSPLPSTHPLADHHSLSSSPIKPPPPSSPSLSSTPSANTTSNRSSSISCTSSTLSNAYASSSSSYSSSSTYTCSNVSSELGRSFSDEFQWSNVRKHPPKPRRTTQPAPSQQQQKAPPPPAVPHKKPPPSWHRVAPTNTSSCPQLQKSFRKDQRISSSTRTASERGCVITSVDDVGKAIRSSNNCNAKKHNRRPDGGHKMKQRNGKVRQKKTESRVHHMMDAPPLLADDQIVDRRGSSHRYCPGEGNDNSLVALDCFIFL